MLDAQGAIDALARHRDALDREIVALLPASPWAGQVARLRCLRGIDTLTAVGLYAEIGDFERFAKAEQLMSYVGLVPSESMTGQKRRFGAITKTAGCSSRQRHYRLRPRIGKRSPGAARQAPHDRRRRREYPAVIAEDCDSKQAAPLQEPAAKAPLQDRVGRAGLETAAGRYKIVEKTSRRERDVPMHSRPISTPMKWWSIVSVRVPARTQTRRRSWPVPRRRRTRTAPRRRSRLRVRRRALDGTSMGWSGAWLLPVRRGWTPRHRLDRSDAV